MTSALALNRLATALTPLEGLALIRAAIGGALAGRVAAISSFGSESAVLLDLIAQADPALPVLVIDTGELFDETRAYIETLTTHLGLSRVMVIAPDESERQAARDLWTTDADRCCALRKVAPLSRATTGFAALIDGRRRAHGFARIGLGSVEKAGDQLKLCPLAGWSDEAIEAAFVARDLPRHPLVAQGYRSIGCWPCTRPVAPGEPARAGRWAGAAKTECGLHPSSAAPPRP